MATGSRITVYFTSKGCGSTYTALQESLATEQHGRFDCVDCGSLVYDWDGLYGFSDWKPFLMRLSFFGRRM
jgi:hypothetical protein